MDSADSFAAADGSLTKPESTAEAERHATNLELFLDLVFVFAVTQIAEGVSEHLTMSGIARGLVIAVLIWWQWSQYTWAGSAADLQRSPVTRILVLATVPATLTAATAIPEAFDTTGRWFGLAYLVVQLLVIGMQGAESLHRDSARAAFLRYASIAAIAPVVVAIGGFLDERTRLILWTLAVLLNVIGALRAGGGEWAINPVHFAERHALFVIISLGEALVAIGASATKTGLTWRTFVGLVVASALACVLWWTYFAFIPHVAEHHLRTRATAARGIAARDLFTFGHFPIVGGIVYFAVVVRHMVPDPAAPLTTGERVLLAVAVAMIIAAYLHVQWRVVRSMAPERFVAIAVVALWCAVTPRLGGGWVVGGVAVVVAVAQAVTWRRFRRGVLAHVAPNR